MNIILSADSYKIPHHMMMPKGTQYVYSYYEARNGAKYPYTVFFGLQSLLKDLADNPVTKDNIDEAYELSKLHFGNDKYFNLAGWNIILNEFGGRIPLEIKAAPEGSVIPVSNVLMTVENTDPRLYWLTNYMETYLSRVWYPTTVATLSRSVKELLRGYLVKSGTENIDTVLNFMLHDFGARGVECEQAAGIGGAAHLVNFLGTDTLAALKLVKDVYGVNCAGHSVAASEHSIMTSRGPEGEADVLNNLLDIYPTGILSVVGDSYSYENFVTNFVCKKFKEKILNRDGVFVVRPDSVTKTYDTPETLMLFTLRELWAEFGGTYTKKGFRVLNPKVRVLWGDGLSVDKIKQILDYCIDNGFAAENLVFGMGGGLLQKVNRDIQRFAFKCSAQYFDGKWNDVYKKPTDESKASKRGLLTLVKKDNKYSTVSNDPHTYNYLRTVFDNGFILGFHLNNFNKVREIAERESGLIAA